MTYIVVFTGPAGSGKTTLTRTYGEWLRINMFLNVCQVNMDPGAEFLPYEPCMDVREFITIKDIMREHGLGPNGAFMKAVEMISQIMDKIMRKQPFNEPEKWDVIIIDTPGQLEAFIFRPETREILGRLQEKGRTVIAYLIDSSMIRTSSDAVSLWFLGILLQVKIGIDVIPIVTKADTLDETREKIIRKLITSPEKLLEDIKDSEGIVSDILPELISITVKTRGAYRPVLVSNSNSESVKDLHFMLHEATCSCGDLT